VAFHWLPTRRAIFHATCDVNHASTTHSTISWTRYLAQLAAKSNTMKPSSWTTIVPVLLVADLGRSFSFRPPVRLSPGIVSRRRWPTSSQLCARRVRTMTESQESVSLQPQLELTAEDRQQCRHQPPTNHHNHDEAAVASDRTPSRALVALTALITTTTTATSQALALNSVPEISQGYLDPTNFNPVCPSSDFFYRFLQTSAVNVVGRESFIEYGPLIAGGLLRVRLELCVVESFVNEAIIPFIRQNGLNWVLPIHETVETFLAGVVFSLATTFILVGSTKILIVIATYTDFLIGLVSPKKQ
jgi:hypothetical protein